FSFISIHFENDILIVLVLVNDKNTGLNSVRHFLPSLSLSLSLSQVSEGVSVASLPDGQTLQVQEVIQTTQPSVIQSPQIQTVQTCICVFGCSNPSDPQKRREILSRRPSYRKIFNELSSDVRAVPKIEEEEKVEEETLATSSVATVIAPSSIYQTSSGQYCTPEFISHKLLCLCGGAIQLAGPGGE
uniref:KID domain-containing protein n=1 Tax=Cyprinus carpio TaxID=7962 RepID=A0A8C1SQ30_CYPCA